MMNAMMMDMFDSHKSEYVIDLSCLSPEKQAKIWAERNKKEEPEYEPEPEPSHRETMLPDSATERFAMLSRKIRMGMRLDDEDAKWYQYAKVLNETEITERTEREIDDRKLYREIRERCERDHLSESLASSVVPLIITYAQGKALKPIILHGPEGCGKTFFASLFAEYLGLPIVKISAPRAETCHGYQGESRTYKSPDAGEFVRGIKETGTIANLFFIDEFDKAAENPESRVRQQDELLTILSEMIIHENFMEFTIDISDSVLVFAVNDISVLSKPFVDRCMVIEFKETELDKMTAIVRDYAERELAPFYAGKVGFDESALYLYSKKLYGMGITSIRQHEKLADEGFRQAYIRYLNSEILASVTASASDYELAIKVMGVTAESHKTIGF